MSEPDTSDRENVVVRTFNAPRELVFQVWTDPTHLAKWWGPKGFTNTFHEFDLRPGGEWRYTMHGPNGGNYENSSVFVEIVHPERIVIDHVSNPKFRVIATFEEDEGKTKVTFRQVFPTAEDREKVKSFAVEGIRQGFDRLQERLAGLAEAA